MAESFDTYTARTITRSFFRSMVGRAMFCGKCNGILDYRRAVLFGTHIVCSTCYDGIRERAVAKGGEDNIAAQEQRMAATLDFIDGRKLKGR